MGFEAPDILMPQVPGAEGPGLGWLLLLVAGVLVVAGWWGWRQRWRRPLRRLRRDLSRGRLTPRAAAHALAAWLRTWAGRQRGRADGQLRADLDALRFRREPPSPARLLALLARAERHAARDAGDA